MPDLSSLSHDVVRKLADKNMTLTTAESCTGGQIAAAITDISGSSAVFGYGYVTYANEAKNEMIGVDIALIEKHGAVSHEVAKAMAEGALKASGADIAISCTGIAGPTGGTDEKPVGLVYVGLCKLGKDPVSFENHFTGNRGEIRHQTVCNALQTVLGGL